MINDKLLNMKEAAEILGIKKQTLYQWFWQRKNLPFIKVGGALRISKKDLMDFIEKRTKYPGGWGTG